MTAPGHHPACQVVRHLPSVFGALHRVDRPDGYLHGVRLRVSVRVEPRKWKPEELDTELKAWVRGDQLLRPERRRTNHTSHDLAADLRLIEKTDAGRSR